MAFVDLETKNLLHDIHVNETLLENNLTNEYENLKADMEKQVTICANLDDVHSASNDCYIKTHHIPCDVCQSQKMLFIEEFSNLKNIHNQHMAEYELYINKLKSNITAKNLEISESSEKYIKLNENYLELQAKFHNYEKLISQLNYENDKLNNQIMLEKECKEQINRSKNQECEKMENKITLIQQQYQESQHEILNYKNDLKNQLLKNEDLNIMMIKLKKENQNYNDENEALKKEISYKDNLLKQQLNESNHKCETDKCEVFKQMNQIMSHLNDQNGGSDVETLIQNFQTQIHALEDEHESKISLDNENLIKKNKELKAKVEELLQEIMRQRDKWTSQAQKLNRLITEHEESNREELAKFHQVAMQDKRDLLRLVMDLRKHLVREKASKAKLIVRSKEEMSQIADRHRLVINKMAAENEGLVKTLKDAKDCLDHLVAQNKTHNHFCTKSLEEVNMQHEKEIGRYKIYVANLEGQLAEIMATQRARHKLKKEKHRQKLLKEEPIKSFRPNDLNSKRSADNQPAGPKLQEIKIADKIFYTIPPMYKGS